MSQDFSVYIALIAYKIFVLIAGVALSYMGFRLFAINRISPAGGLEASAGAYKLKLNRAAPGIFFTLFGAVIICFSIFKGVHYSREPILAGHGETVTVGDMPAANTPSAAMTNAVEAQTLAPVEVVLPAKPPS